MNLIKDLGNQVSVDYTDWDLDEERRTDSLNHKKKLEREMVLTSDEINKIITYQFYIGPNNTKEQIYNYYLMIKQKSPNQAEELLNKLHDYELESENDITWICFLLNRYISWFVLTYKNKHYSINNGNVKIVTISKD